MFRNIFWLLMITIIASIGRSYAQGNNNMDLYHTIIKRDKMIVGVSFDSKPFGFKDTDGQIKGLEVDLAKEIAERLLGDEDKVVFKNVSSQDRIMEVNSGNVDMIISMMTITPQRKKQVDFSIPYFIAGQAICVRKDGKIEVLDDLLNKRVIVELGTTGEKNIKQFAPNALIIGYDDNSKAIGAFVSGWGDAIITDDSLLQGLVMDNSGYVLLPKKLTKEPYGIAFKKSGRTKSLRENVNKIIKDITLDGTLLSIKNKWGIN